MITTTSLLTFNNDRPSNRFYINLLLSCLLSLIPLSSLAAPLYSINGDVAYASLLPHVDIFIDESEELSAIQIVNAKYVNQFAPLQTKKIHFGFEKKTYWLRFTLEQRSPEQHRPGSDLYYLEAAPALLDHIDLYRLNSQTGALELKQRNGGFLPYSERAIKHPLHIFRLQPKADGLTTYYLRISSQTSIDVRLNLTRADLFTEFDSKRRSWTSLLYGTLIAVMLIQIGFSILFKKGQYAIYAGYVLSLFCFQSSWNGSLNQFFPTQINIQEQLLIFSIYFSTALCFLFARLYLNTAERSPNWDKAILFLASTALLSSLISFYTSYSINGHIAVLLALTYTIILFVVAIIEMVRDNPRAVTYLFARFCSFITIVITLICALGFVTYPEFLQYGVILALSIESVLMTIFIIHHHLTEQRSQISEVQSVHIQEANQQSLSDTIRKISHDIRTPMSGISGMAELLLDSPLTESQRKQVLTIKSSGDSLLNIISNLSTSPGMGSGEVELQQISFNLPSLISECVDIYQAQAEEKQLELISDVHYSAPKLVRGDPNRLQQILMHLLSLTFAKSKNGEVVVSVRASKATSLIEFDIVNTGVDNLEEFTSSLSPTTESNSDNSAHEFTVATQLCKLMGGQLGVEPNYNNGIRIWFTANMPGIALDETTEREYDNILRKRKLLVVDDNETFRQVIQQQASSWGMQISSARSGMEALAILRSQAILEEQFDVLIVDHRMPTMSGLQLAEKIKEDPLLQSGMLIIMLTGVTKAPSENEARSAGIRRVLTKPVSAQSLKITLAEEFSSLHSNNSDDVSA